MMLLLLSLAALVAIANGQCTGRADVVIAVPGGSDISAAEFDGFENGVIELLNYLQIDEANFNVGFVLYGSQVVDIGIPDRSFKRDQVNTRVSLLARRKLYEAELGKKNDVAKAIDRVSALLQNPVGGRRAKTEKIGIIFQNGKAENAVEVRKIIESALSARQSGVLLFGVNANGQGQEFRYMGADSCRLDSFDTFSRGLPAAIKKLANGVCAAMDETVTVRWWNCLPKEYSPIMPLSTSCAPGDIMIADPNNCAYYYDCQSGVAQKKSCKHNKVFDRNMNVCNFKKDVMCYTNVKNLPTCPQPRPIFAHPFECTKYMFCLSKVAFIMDCQDGHRYDEAVEDCVDLQTNPCP